MMLWNYTDEGRRNIKQSPPRFDDNKEDFQALGGTIKGFYLTTGNFDGVMIVEAPDEQTIAKLSLLASSKGAIRTQILRAYSEDEYRQIIDAVPSTS
jgi:uncharacterized protein with GYD domain